MLPLDLPGPSFLAVYAMLAAVVCLLTRGWISRHESLAGSRILRVRDPYEIAYLRGGTAELVQVVALALMRRGLLMPLGTLVVVTPNGRSLGPALAIERVIVAACRSATPAAELHRQGAVRAAALEYHRGLAGSALLPSPPMQSARFLAAGLAAAFLAGVSAVKISHALAHGHRNVLFLIGGTLLAVFVLYRIATTHRTAAGDEALQHLKSLFARVQRGPRPTGADQLHEALLLAAVYGDYAFPGMAQRAWRKLFQPAAPNQSSDGGCSGGSCGSSGCGGGGGGCGGCGS